MFEGYTSYQQCTNQLEGIQAIDYFLARKLSRIISDNCKTADQDGLLFHSIMAASQALRSGHSCLKLDAMASTDKKTLYWYSMSTEDEDKDQTGYYFPTLADWHQYLSQLAIRPEDKQALVYEYGRLYLRRYWQFEEQLSNSLRNIIFQKDDQQIAFDRLSAQRIIEQLFPPSITKVSSAEDTLDWQKIAVANALIHRFSIIAGGPGTGKTFTVSKILAALQVLADNQLRIAMVAPTGKAAQRLNESIQKARMMLRANKLISEETLNSIPDVASTVHRLLGVIPGCHDFIYQQNKKLPYDVILIDEISMIDLPLMTRLMRAINNKSRLILLGDANQLPSVAAGSILADLAPQQTASYSAHNCELLNFLTGFDITEMAFKTHQKYSNEALVEQELNLDHLTVLHKSHRFDGSGEISNLAKYVIKGDSYESWHYLEQAKEQIERIKNMSFRQWLEDMVDYYYKPLFQFQGDDSTGMSVLTIAQAFEQLNQFRILAATRQGEQGVETINQAIEQILRDKGMINSNSAFYPGRPIMIVENHYNLGLYNGDTGLLWINNERKLQAVFPEKDSVRWLGLGRLPQVETVYAMTIHKTQGSEFKHVALVLPEIDSPILSRELLYTGITRASERLSIFANENIFKTGVQRKVMRYSGLRKKVFD